MGSGRSNDRLQQQGVDVYEITVTAEDASGNIEPHLRRGRCRKRPEPVPTPLKTRGTRHPVGRSPGRALPHRCGLSRRPVGLAHRHAERDLAENNTRGWLCSTVPWSDEATGGLLVPFTGPSALGSVLVDADGQYVGKVDGVLGTTETRSCVATWTEIGPLRTPLA